MNDRSFPFARQSFSSILLAFAFLAMFCVSNAQAQSEGPEWIWSPQSSALANSKSQGECFFRKKFTLIGPEKAEMIFSAGDEYEIHLNGRLVTQGQSFGKETKVDASNFILPGVNLLAVRVRHYESEQPGLSLRFRVKEKSDVRWRSLKTDDSWKTRTNEVTQWNRNTLNDMAWVSAQVLKPAAPKTEVGKSAVASGSAPTPAAAPSSAKAPTGLKVSNSVASKQTAEPAIDAKPAGSVGVADKISLVKNDSRTNDSQLQKASSIQLTDKSKATSATVPMKVASGKLEVVSRSKNNKPSERGGDKTVSEKDRFEVSSDFTVQQIMSGKETGSLVAMEFNEFGKLLLSREGGPLMIADLSKPEGHPQRLRTYCSQVNTCQGILPLNGSVYVTASGPQGLGLYKLTDLNNDGMLTVEDKLVGFSGQLGEHGPHGIQLGYDGMLYVVVGNNSQVSGKVSPTSAYKNFYEGDLVPRFEDPGGHAQGVKAPGGTVIRVSLDGTKVERIAGGIRNAYDLVLDPNGDVFLHDSDMESDIGTTWYRPTTVFHVADGAEIGWRSGWAKFPEYFVDQAPAVATTGRGSPTGAVLYQHIQFPAKYHDRLFFADWSEGRILSVKPEPNGAGFIGKPETFVSGRPLNVCDLAIGEDGALYFCTGGRGTAGGVFRVIFNGEIPEQLLNFESDLAKVLRHPQPNAAWARQNIAQIRVSMGSQWGTAIEGVVREKRNSSKVRVRALQLMVLYGPAISNELLQDLATDTQPEVRAQIARMCVMKNSAQSEQVLLSMVSDNSPYVRRVACESCIRAGVAPSFESLIPMLASLDRTESTAARRLLERIPVANWESQVLQSNDNRVFINGSIAMMSVEPNLQRSYQVLAKSAKIMEGFVNDRDFVDILRTMQIALAQGEVESAKVQGLTARMVNEFPSNSPVINRELSRVLGFLKAGNFEGRLETYLANPSVTAPDKVHVAMFLLHGQDNLTQSERVALVDALETSRSAENTGGSYDQYVLKAIESISGSVAGTDIPTVLANGHRWPKTVLTAFYKLPVKLDQATTESVIDLDKRIRNSEKIDQASSQVRLGVIAILARDGSEKGMEYLRQIWQLEPNRRNDIVIGLSQQPAGDNWAYLVSSLGQLDDLTSREVMEKLVQVNRRPRDAKHYRDTITVGYRLRGSGANVASDLIQHWSGEKFLSAGQNWQTRLEACRTWFAKKWPEESPIQWQANEPENAKLSVAQVFDTLSQSGLGNASRGKEVFAKAQCATCHRVGSVGESVGPELSNLASRFSLREVIESTIHPSAVVPDRYATKTILTIDGVTITGMTILQPDGTYFVLQPDGKRIRVATSDIEEMKDDPRSAMPEGLLDGLSSTEVADLFAFLMQPVSEDRTASSAASKR